VYGVRVKCPRSQASDLLKDNPDISERVKELISAAAKGVVMTLQQEMEYLTKVLNTPLSQIDSDHLFCQREKVTKSSHEIAGIDKLGAMRLLADLKKELSDKPGANINVAVTVKVMTEDRRRELMARHKAGLEAARSGPN
jgi:hypothetical protein